MSATKRFILILSLILGGCTTLSLDARHEKAARIAQTAGMGERVIPAGIFNLTAWEKVTKPGAPAHIYIEGDGLAWLNKNTKSLNPTPPDPLALRLAAADQAENVIYLARPCQFSGWNNPDACPALYWTNGRTAPEVIEAYRQALDHIKAAYPVTGFHLIGYSGGAAVAALAAAGRTDILSLRTIAGNLDYTAFSALHHISVLDASRNPAEAAAALAQIPQRHFIGGEDVVIPPAIFDSWKRASGGSNCVHSTIVPGATHEKGWAEKWAGLLREMPICE